MFGRKDLNEKFTFKFDSKFVVTYMYFPGDSL